MMMVQLQASLSQIVTVTGQFGPNPGNKPRLFTTGTAIEALVRPEPPFGLLRAGRSS